MIPSHPQHNQPPLLNVKVHTFRLSPDRRRRRCPSLPTEDYMLRNDMTSHSDAHLFCICLGVCVCDGGVGQM